MCAFKQPFFGLFQGGPAIPVTLRFRPFRARWIKQQQWHPDQCFIEQPDGCLDLTVPVTDFREIKMQILQFGADVEVISPEELRQEVMAEIESMGCLYQQRPHRGERPAKKNPRGGTSDV